MALMPGHVANFETLKRAAIAGDLALVECKDATTGEYRAVVCAMMQENGEYQMIPFGHLSPGNPFEDYIPPV